MRLARPVALGGDQHRPVVGDEAAQRRRRPRRCRRGRSGRPRAPRSRASPSSSPANGVRSSQRTPEVAGLLAQLGQGAEGRGAEHGGEVDRHGVAARGVGPAGVEELLAGGDEVVGAGAHPLGVARDEHGAVGQQVEQGLHAVDERRGERLHALDGDALGELLEQVGGTGQLVGERRGARAHGVGEQQLAARRRPQAVLGDLEAALVGDLEPADLLDRVAPELQRAAGAPRWAGRRRGCRRAPRTRRAARRGRCGCRRRPRARSTTSLERSVVAGLRARPARRSPRPLAIGWSTRAHRGDDHRQRAVGVVAGVGVGQPAQHRQALADGVAARAEPLVRQRLPARGTGRRHRRPGSPRASAVQVLGLAAGGGDGEDRGAACGSARARRRRGAGRPGVRRR